MNNNILIILGFVVFTFLLSASAVHPSHTAPFPPGAKAGDLSLKECSIKLNSGKYSADCGTLIVPENRSKKDSRLISLPVIRIRATGKNPAEPIFYLEGGPGMSNMRAQPTAGLLADHDFIMVGYRGVDGSVILDCPEISEAIIGDGKDVLDQHSLAKLSGAIARSTQRFQNEGVDLDGYSILEVAADMDAGRAALGYERINLFSASYGTRVAQIYAYQYPDRVQRSAMIGVNPPGHFIWEPAMVDTQIEYYSQLYSQTKNPRTGNLAETVRSVAHNMPAHWLLFPIDPGKVKSVTFAMLFQRSTAAMAFDAYIAAEKGDPSGLALMSIAYDFMIPNMMVWGDFYSKGFSADFYPRRDYFAEMDPENSIIGAPLSKLIYGDASGDGKMIWPAKLIPPEFRQVQRSDVETLLVSGTVDFSTPAKYATEELLSYLKNGKQVILAEMGHVTDMMTLQPKASERLLVSFYDTGKADNSQFKHLPMDFEVKFGFPLIAKISAAAAVLIIPLVIAGGWLMVNRIKLIQRKRPHNQTR